MYSSKDKGAIFCIVYLSGSVIIYILVPIFLVPTQTKQKVLGLRKCLVLNGCLVLWFTM